MVSRLAALLLCTGCLAQPAGQDGAEGEHKSVLSHTRLPRQLRSTVFSTVTLTATLDSSQAAPTPASDELPPWADKLVEKILSAIATACPQSGPAAATGAGAAAASGWSVAFGDDYPEAQSSSLSDHAGGSVQGNTDNNGCSGNSCTADGGAFVPGSQPLSPPDNPHEGEASDSPSTEQENGTGQPPAAPGSASPKSSCNITSPQTSRFVDPKWPDHVVTGYFGSGQAAEYPPSALPWQYLTHVCYAFAKTTAESGLTYDEALLGELSCLARQNGVKPVLSIGGYGLGGAYFSEIVSSNETLELFVETVKQIVDEFDLAGVDLDWEFVGDLSIPEDLADVDENPATDAANYLNLLKALRKVLGPSIELSAAVPMNLFQQTTDANPNQLSFVNMQPYEPYFDRIYLMGYDLWRGVGSQRGTGTAGANAAVDRPSNTAAMGGQVFTSDGIDSWGVAFPAQKLVYGAPFYGFGYTLAANSTPETTGLYSPTTGKSRGDDAEGPNSTSGFWRWRNLKSQGAVQQMSNGSYAAGDGWTKGWDATTQTPFLYTSSSGNGSSTSSQRQIISYDDPDSLRLKRAFAQQQGLGGMMFWIASADTDDGELAGVLAGN